MKIFGIIGYKNAGKTGLMERLVAEITGRGYRVSTIKHAHHSFDVDQKGKDSFRHRAAGAQEVLLASRNRWALMHESPGAGDPLLADLLAKIAPVDLVLIEGFKRDNHPKIEAHRGAMGHPLIAPNDSGILAVASDVDLPELVVPRFDLDDTKAIADFLLAAVDLSRDVIDPEIPNLSPPPLRDDCFALPDGVDWVPVDRALDLLHERMVCTMVTTQQPVSQALGRILATDVLAQRSNPPAANSAVDGYGFAHGALKPGDNVLPLADGRSAAGAPFEGALPHGQALRILTGALIPPGVDTVIMQEDTTTRDGFLALSAGVRPGANIRRGGEDVQAGDVILPKARRLSAMDLALLTATGCEQVSVYQKLRVGVLSTGDEIVTPGAGNSADKTYDANRPMLLGLVDGWGYEAVDLGHVGDDRDALEQRLQQAKTQADVILTSGGASAGDEDHLAALLAEKANLFTWRIAIKPGRPLALALWDGVPVFGLPGNPVAALICALIFARPALSELAGGGWQSPQGFDLPAAFAKRKKPGRREYLRARLTDGGAVEPFASEGSGRISGLSWADGLLELADGARDIRLGDPVRFIPFASFGV